MLIDRNFISSEIAYNSKKLDRRYTRLSEFLSKNVPSVIIKNELRLIKEACDQLIILYNKQDNLKKEAKL